MKRATWAVVILWVLLMVTTMTGPDPPDGSASVLGFAVAAFALLYVVIVVAPAKVRAWRANRASG